MKHAQTIAMARGLLAEGRARDVAHMLEPLVASMADPMPEMSGADQALLRCLLARMRLLCDGNVLRAQTLLQAFAPLSAREALTPAAQAETALWLGWIHTWPATATCDGARALALLTEAERLFCQEMSTAGRCWALLGKAWAYVALDEYPLMRQALRDAAALQDKEADQQAALWALDLHILDAYFQGRYAQALTSTDTFKTHARRTNDAFAVGRAHAYRALLFHALGRPPALTIDAAAEAETRLQHAAVKPGYALRFALQAHVGAEIRSGAWDQAEKHIAHALAATADQPGAAASLLLDHACLNLRRDACDAAEARLSDAEAQVRHHRETASRLALTRCMLSAQRRQWPEARAGAERACRIARETGLPAQQLEALLHLAQIKLAQGHVEAAHHTLGETQRYSDLFSVLPIAARRFMALGDFAHAEQDVDDARSYYAQARSTYTLIGDAYRAAQAQQRLASLDVMPQAVDRRVTAEEQEVQTAPGTAKTPTEPTNLGALLARASSSVELIAETWLKEAARHLPDRWLGVYRCDEGHPWACVRERGPAPAVPTTHEPCGPRLQADNVLWVRLRGHPGPAFFFGLALEDQDDPAWQATYAHLKPWLPVASLALEHALLHAETRDGATAPSADPTLPLDGFVYASPAMRDVVAQVHRVRASHSPVLITGERGVGKALLARLVHTCSERRDAPFVMLACANVTDELFERHLFGHVDGPPGALVSADGGTLLLDNVDALSPGMQHRLVRFLQDGDVLPLGAAAPVRVDVRLIATTSRDLTTLVRSGRFVEDLRYRLKVIPMALPPLRERREEIPLLIRHFFNTLRPADTPLPTLTQRAVNTLLHYDWPGNVRQLRNEIERLLALVRNEPAPLLDTGDFSPAILEDTGSRESERLQDKARHDAPRPDHDLDQVLADTEKRLIERVLTEHEGHVTASADALSLTRQGLYKKMKRLGIDPSTFHPESSREG